MGGTRIAAVIACEPIGYTSQRTMKGAQAMKRYHAIGIAFCVGALLGFLASSRD